ncbi:CEP76 C2 domain-containing protein, partial [Baffinella frigidus]
MQDAQHQKLRSVIDEHLRSSNVYGKVRSFVRDFLSEDRGVVLDEDKLLSALHEKRVVEELLGSLGSENERLLLRPRAGAGASARAITPGRGGLFLHVRVGKGSAFLDPLLDSNNASKGTLVAHVLLQGQRHATRPCAASVEPAFDDGMLFQMNASDRASLKTLHDQLHIVVVQHSSEDNVTVLGTQKVEWRKVLLTGILSMVVELSGLGGDTSMPVGALGLQLELLPRPPSALCSEEQVRSQVKSEKDAEGETDRRFFAAAKTWWKDFLQIRPEHSGRAVKIFARTETDVLTPVCSFIRPLEAGRSLRSAGEAARFVSLIEFERLQTLGGTGGRSEVWADLHTVLVSRKGDVEEHAVLLCSLLLGFRLDAYCAIGSTLSGEAHMWVVTLERHDPALPPSVTFWESLTGSRYLHKGGDSAPSHKYGRVGCIFNHQAFFANIQ